VLKPSEFNHASQTSSGKPTPLFQLPAPMFKRNVCALRRGSLLTIYAGVLGTAPDEWVGEPYVGRAAQERTEYYANEPLKKLTNALLVFP
jgi:hypothetical protein